jgi:excisionase family DNA binding protein
MRADLLTRPEAADYIGVSVSTLARWACLREKLPYRRVGRRTLYRKSDLDDFLDLVAVRPVRLGCG